MHLFRTKLLAESDEDTELTKSIKARVLSYLEDKYADPSSSELLNVACFLDPRFVKEYIPCSVELSIVKDRLAREGAELTVPEPTSGTQQQCNDEAEPPCKKRKLGSWLKEAKPREPTSTVYSSTEASVKEEIE